MDLYDELTYDQLTYLFEETISSLTDMSLTLVRINFYLQSRFAKNIKDDFEVNYKC